MDQNMASSGQKCPCPHHKMVPIFIILFGLLFLLAALDVVSNHVTGILWPIIVMAIGFQKLFEMRCRCCRKM